MTLAYRNPSQLSGLACSLTFSTLHHKRGRCHLPVTSLTAPVMAGERMRGMGGAEIAFTVTELREALLRVTMLPAYNQNAHVLECNLAADSLIHPQGCCSGQSASSVDIFQQRYNLSSMCPIVRS